MRSDSLQIIFSKMKLLKPWLLRQVRLAPQVIRNGQANQVFNSLNKERQKGRAIDVECIEEAD